MDYFSSEIMKAAQDVLFKIEELNYDAVIVGGCVRDLILGQEPHDVDISTNCPIKVLEQIFDVCADIGKNKQFGIIVIKHKNFRFEIAQYRTEIYKKPKYVEKII